MDWHEQQPLQTAVRELQEETGIVAGADLEDLALVQRYTILPQWRARYAPGVRENREHAFALRVTPDCEIRTNPEEHSAYLWLDFASAAARASSWSNRSVIVLLQQRLTLGPH